MKRPSLKNYSFHEAETLPSKSTFKNRFLVGRRDFTCAVAKMPYVDLFLLYTRSFSNETGIVIGTPIGSTHGVKAVPTAVYVTYTPVEKDNNHRHWTKKGFTVRQTAKKQLPSFSPPSATQGRTMLCHGKFFSDLDARIKTSLRYGSGDIYVTPVRSLLEFSFLDQMSTTLVKKKKIKMTAPWKECRRVF